MGQVACFGGKKKIYEHWTLLLPLFFGTDYFERRWLSISQHFVRHLSAEIYGMKDKRCVLFFSSLRIFYDSISLRHQRDRSTVDVPLLKLFFFSFPCAIPPVFFSFILWRARRISDDTPGSSPNCHHPIAACNDTHPQREVSFSFSDWGGALVQSGPTVGLYSFWFLKFCCRPGRARLIMGHDCCRRCPRL